MTENEHLKLDLLNLLKERYNKDPGRFVNQSAISVELNISKEDALKYADYLVNNNWATISEPDTSRWRIMITDDGIKEMMRVKQIIIKAMKEKPKKNEKSVVRLETIQHQIEEKKLEAERRQAVVETKKLGAEIEIITILREELKRRNDDTEKIPEIKKQLDRIEDRLDKLTVFQPKIEFQEDVMYKELMSVTLNSPNPSKVDARREGKRHYYKIKLLKKEISKLEKQIEETTGIFVLRDLDKIRNPKQAELDMNLKRLAELWAEFS